MFPDRDITGSYVPNTASDGVAPSTFDPSLEYSTDKVVFWQPPSFFSQWSPSSFVIDDVSYSCAEQFMMAEKARLFKGHRAVELIMSSSDPSTHKRVGRGVRNFGTAVWDREKQNAVLSGNYAQFTQNPAMKLHRLSTGNKRLAEASPLDSVWGIGLRADDPCAKHPHKWRGKIFSVRHSLTFATQFATSRPDRHTRPPLVDSGAPPEMLESTKSRPLNSRAWGPRSALTKALLRPFFRVRPATKARRFWR